MEGLRKGHRVGIDVLNGLETNDKIPMLFLWRQLLVVLVQIGCKLPT